MPTYRIQAPNGRTYTIEGPPGATQEEVAAAVLAQNPEAGEPPVETTLGGQVKEFFKGIPAGAVNMVESAATGASALLPDEMEPGARDVIRRAAGAVKAPFAPAQGYEDTVGAKLGQATGSFLPFLALGPLGTAGRAAAVGLGAGAGAGEARVRAEQEGATGDQKGLATALGAGVGLSEVFAPFRILGRVPDLAKANGIKMVQRALQAGGEEAAQEAAANWAQNLIAQQIYKPEQELIEGLGESAAYGGSVGALVQGVMDLALGRRARAGAAANEAARREAAAEEERKRAEAEQARLEQGYLEAERAAPAAVLPETGARQASLPGLEGTPDVEETPTEQLDPVQRAGFLRAQIPQIDALMDEIRQANLAGATLAQREAREQRMEQLRQARAQAEQELAAMNLPDAGSIARDVSKIQKQLQMADESGDTQKALQLARRLEELGGAQGTLDLGKPRALTDPAENAREAQVASDRQAVQAELGQRQEDLRAQRPAPEDTRMDLFQQSTADVEEQRATGETNFDYLDPIFEKAFEGQPAAVAVPQAVQPTPDAERMLRRLDELEQKASGDPRNEGTRQAQTEILQLTSDDGTPFMQELRKARVEQSQALMELQSTLDDIRSGIFLGGSEAALGTTTRAGLNKRAEDAKQRFIRAMLQEAAVRRRGRGDTPLTTDEALRAADAANTTLEELLTRGQAMPARVGLRFDQRAPELSREAANLKRAVDVASQRLLRAQQALAAMAESTRGMTSPEAIRRSERLQAQAEKDVAARMLDLQKARDRFATARKTLVPGAEQVTKGDTRDLEERPFGRYRAALGSILEQLDSTRAGLNAPTPRRSERPLLRQQFAETEARRTAEAAGETAKTPAGRDRRETEYIEGLLDKLEQRGQNVTPLRDRLEKHPTADVRSAVRAIALARLDGRAPSPQERRALDEAVKTARAAAPDQPGQKDLFGTEDKAFTRATPANFQRALDRAPEVLKARKALETAKQALKAAEKAPKQAQTEVRPARDTMAGRVRGSSSDPEIQKAMDAVEDQRDRLAEAMAAARAEALAADQKARDVVYKPAVAAAQRKLSEARSELHTLTSWPYTLDNGAPTQPEVVAKLRQEIDETQTRLDALQQGAVARADSTMNSYAFAQDSVVQFEKALLADMESALERLIAGVPNIAQQREMSRLAAEQRARVAAEEKRARDIADEHARQRRELDQRLRSGDGLPALRSEDRRANRGLKARYDALTQAIETPDPRVQQIQGQLAELEAQPNPDVKAKRKIRDVRKRLENAQDAAGARMEQLEQQRREIKARMQSNEYLTQQEREERAALEKMERERGTALDALKTQPFTPKKRSTTPAFREGRPGEPRKLRTGSPESLEGQNAPKPAAVGIKESTRPPVSRREVPKNDMAEANRIAAELKAKTPEQRAQEAKEARAVAREMAKGAGKSGRGSRAQRAIEEADETDVFDADDLFNAGADGDEALREDNSYYEANKQTPVSTKAEDALEAGDVDGFLAEIEANGSTPFHRSLARALRPFVRGTKIEIVENLHHEGQRAFGLYAIKNNTVQLDTFGGFSEEVVLHELVHAATLRSLRNLARLDRGQQEALAELQSLYEQIKDDPLFKREYANKSLEEFVSELMTNTQVRDKVNRVAAGQSSMLQRIYTAILNFLGIPRQYSTQPGKDAVMNVVRIFTPSQATADAGPAVASVMRGMFPATKPEYEGVPTDMQSLADRIVGREPTLVDRIMANASGLALRTQFLDRFAPVDALIEKGVSKGMLSDAQALQTSYFLRFGEQRNQFVEQAATTAVPQLHKNADGDYVIEAPEGKHANLARIADTLSKAGVGNEQATEKLFTTYLAVKRGEQVGFDKLNYDGAVTPADAAKINAYVNGTPQVKEAFEQARKLYREYNDNLLDLMVQTGAMTKDKAQALKKGDYVPYYRQDPNGVVNLIVAGEQPIRIGNIKDQPYLQELVGGNEKILPFFSGAMQNTSMLVDMALRNKQIMEVGALLQNLGLGKIRAGAGPRARNVLHYTINGDPVHMVLDEAVDAFGVPADLLVKGLEGIKTTLPAGLRLLQMPTNILRTFITRSPAYAVRQLVREPINAWLVSGAGFTPVLSSVQKLHGVLSKTDPATNALERSGAISSNVFTGDMQDQARILRDVQSGKTPWQAVMSAADKMAVGSDTATRAVLYDKYRKQGMTHMQAVMGTLETMNFSRRGLSPTMQMMSLLVPFFNAQVQGVDVIYRSLRGKSPMEKRLDVQKKLFVRGLGITAATLAYAALMSDDEAYKNATPEQRALNWFLPLPGMDEPLRVPIPFELGYLFKALPELVFNTAFGDTKTGEAASTIGRLAWQTVPIGIPQALKPALEVATNYSFFTDSPVESTRERSLQPEARIRDNTTELAKMIGGAGGLSPVQIDYLIRGYTGGLGLTLLGLASSPMKLLTPADVPELPTPRTSQMPFIGALFQPVDGRAAIDGAFEDIQSWQQAHNTFQMLAAQGKRAEALQFAQRFGNEIALNSTGGAFRQQMGELAKMRRAIVSRSDLTPQEKRERVDRIRQVEIALSRRIRELGDRPS